MLHQLALMLVTVNLNFLAILFVCVGFILCLVEVFIPGLGVFGITGGLLYIIGLIIGLINGMPIWAVILMLLLGIAVGVFLVYWVSRAIKKGKLGKSSIFNVGTAIPTGVTEGTKDYTYLLGKEGTTITFLRPVGVAKFNGEVIDVVAKTGIIDEGQRVVVVQVEGQRVVVEVVE
ncbi:MAG: NfeD family protein [Clostridia bacterium]|nr:NfeD family protein [Clostridia bacterium]